jgi:hypothetical protein
VAQNPSYASLRTGAVPQWGSLPPLLQLIGKAGQWMLPVAKLCLMALLFQAWSSVKARALVITWLAAEVAAAVFAMGARRDVAMLLIAAILFYHRLVKPLAVARAAVLATALLAGLLAFGFVRDFSGQGVTWTSANEFQTLFANACDMDTRRHGLHVPWAIYLSDLVRLVPRGWLGALGSPVFDPSYWYLDLLGAPAGPGVGRMFGVVPQAMIGWDWPELVLRGAVLGLVFAFVHRWYVRRSASLWATAFYVFLCLWSYFTVRSTTFHILLYVVYGFVPSLAVLVWARAAVAHVLARQERASPAAVAAQPAAAVDAPALAAPVVLRRVYFRANALASTTQPAARPATPAVPIPAIPATTAGTARPTPTAVTAPPPADSPPHNPIVFKTVLPSGAGAIGSAAGALRAGVRGRPGRRRGRS